MKKRFGIPWLTILAYVVFVFTMIPLVVVVLSVFTTTDYPIFPPIGFSWKWWISAFQNESLVRSFSLSLGLAAATAVASTTLGTLAAMAIVRYRFIGRDLISTFLTSPLILPAVLIGVGLLQFYVLVGVRASFYTLWIGHIIITVPYVMRLVSVSLAGFDRNLELAARNLGASALQTFWRITFPIILSGIVAGFAFAFIISMDDVTVTVFLTNPQIVTLPMRIFAQWEYWNYPYISAAGSWMIFFAAIVMVVIERTVGLGKVFGVELERK
ncbi:MAG: ABC transporter permease [Chloroflexi bacterium]|nr:ABC transporter permease [Chloroflexota bacterium]